MRLAPDDLASRLQPLFEEAGLWRNALAGAERDWFLNVLALLQPRAKKLGQVVDDARPFLEDEVTFDDAAVRKYLGVAGMREHLAALSSSFAAAQPFAAAELEILLRSVADARGVKPATLIHATRVAVTGRSVSPGLYEVLELLGRDRVRARLASASSLASE